MLRLHDTATGAVHPLELRDPGSVSMYVCGPTVYGLPHLGHGRFTLVFDVLRRYLLFCGLDVRYISNVTDIDDNIINRAASEGRTESEVAQEFEAVWWEAMDALGVLRPTVTPHATEYVDEMVRLIGELVDLGIAYEVADGVYLSVEQVNGYGLLARQPLDSLRAGARVVGSDDKRSPLDFALWKKAKPGEPTWEAPWGSGRPGWHTECVVMSLGLLGEQFDLHGGGIDLAFPHHENERAQAVALGRKFARHWVHNGWVTVGGEKMSKSLGNYESLTDLLDRSDPRAYRVLVLQAHYRKPVEVTPESIAQAERSLGRLDAAARRFALPERDASSTPLIKGADGLDEAAAAHFFDRMDDDLDTPGAMSGIFELVTRANAAADADDPTTAQRLAHTAGILCSALGLDLRGSGTQVVDAETAGLIAARDQARVERDWRTADQLRAQLNALGWTVEDGPDGTLVRR